jgi:AAA15 family ATPase/GTPase
MIQDIWMENMGPIRQMDCPNLGHINLIIGPNQSGKTFLLKSLYASLKTVELYQRGKEKRSDKEILADKLYWTFQPESLGNIVRKGASQLSFRMKARRGQKFAFSFGPSTDTKVTNLDNTFAPRSSNTIFIPAKEIISIRDIIIEMREEARFGFEEPYSDLAKSLKRTYRGRNYAKFSEARQHLNDIIGGRLEYDEKKNDWKFRDNSRRLFEINMASEGVKKLSILEVLLGNHYLDDHSVIIIDELEANLHPAMITRMLQIVRMLSECGVQFFISTHSYFVIKRLYIMAHQNDMDIPVISFDQGACTMANLREEMPHNPIIEESIALYRDEISL